MTGQAKRQQAGNSQGFYEYQGRIQLPGAL